MDVTPVNYQQRDSSPEAIAHDVDYALQVCDFYAGAVPGGASGLAGRSVLELGPGSSLGAAVLLACHGARVTVADRYLAPWDDGYHVAFLHALLPRLAAERPALSREPIRALLDAGAFATEQLQCLHLGTEDLHSVPAQSFDIVVSNAVFEHIEDVPAALANLARITRGGGCGVHQVDFRDHRDFERPLEFLALSREAFRAEFAFRKGECGNRWRHGALGAAMRRAGFEVADFRANLFAEPAYVADVRARLHRDYTALDDQELAVLSGCFVLRRPVARAQAGTIAGAETDSGTSIARRRARYAFARPFAVGRTVLDVGCGSGLGSRQLLEAGPQSLTGLDARRDQLDLARLLDPEGRADRYRAWELGTDLPVAEGSCGLLLGFELLETLTPPQRAHLVQQARRVLAPDGVALFSVPQAGPAPVAPAAAPLDMEAFVTLLADFAWVEFFGLVDLGCSLVLPLEGGAAATVTGQFVVPAAACLEDPATTGIIALCRGCRPVAAPVPPPVAFAARLREDGAAGAGPPDGPRASER